MSAEVKVNRTPPWPLFSALLSALLLATHVPYAASFLPECPEKPVFEINIEPVHYDVYIQPAIDEGTFTGFINISFIPNKVVSSLEVNSLGLNVYDEQITDPEMKSLIPIDTKYVHEPGESIVYITKLVFPIDRTLIFSAKFNGTLQETNLGFYRSYYVDSESSTKRWYAETQFQATNARRAFPCFDDPQFRTTFAINIGHKSTLNAFSNTKLESISEPDDQGIVWSRFEETPRMPTYLVAFAVNDFVSTNGKMKIWARKDAIGQVEVSQKLTSLFVTALESWTNQVYALSKLDQIASRGHHGAMENWGLIIYKERLLADHPNATTLDTINSRLTLAHELAHQWFGNLVTLKTWKTVWLSEGFANLMQYLVVDEVKREWNLWGLFPITEMNKAFALDELFGAKPITHNVVTPAEILANFNTLSYSKGACVLRMMQHALGEDTFQGGVMKYLDVMRMGNAVPEDLYGALAYQADVDDALPEGIVLARVLDSWTRLEGYPVVNVTRDKAGHEVYFAQDRFCLNCKYTGWEQGPKSPYFVPVSFATKKTYKKSTTRPSVWLAPGEGALLDDVDESAWIIANRERTGYFRVNYETENWNQLIKQLMSSPTVLSATDIAMLIDDAAALAFTGRMQPDILINLLSYLPLETRAEPWVSATNVILEKLSPKFGIVKDENNLIYQKWLQLVVEGAYDNFGPARRSGEKDTTRILRQSLLRLAREADLELYNWDTRDKENEPDSDNEEAYLCSKIKFGPKNALVEAVARVKSLDVEEDLQRMKIVRSLACTQSVDSVRLLLTYSVTESGFTDAEKTNIWNTALRSINGTDVALDILKANHNDIMSRYGEKFLATRVVSLARYLDDEYELLSLEKYIELYIGYATTINTQTQLAVETVRGNIKWKSENLAKWVSLMKKAKVPVAPRPIYPHPEYRLPNNVVPVHYDLTLHPDLVNFSLQGEVVMTADVKVETDTITLHSVNLTVKSTKVTNGKTGEDIAIASVKPDPVRELLLISLSHALPPETQVKVSISFDGVLSDDLLGFYRSSYEENHQIKWLAATQFEPTYARRAFPCMDEPGFRATFQITVLRQQHLKVLGNMPVKSTSAPDSNGVVTDIFEQTPNMATYLVALVVSEFKSIPISTESPAITVWARPDITQAITASKVSAALLGNMSIAFGVPQPVPKYDLVALPDFALGAMENWGLVTFREYLLANDESAGTAIQQRIALIIAHELAHQWFGNLLTVKWWSTLWQQEGMATFISYIAVENVQKTTTPKERLVTKEFYRALEADSMESSLPLNYEVYLPEEIAARSDDITYAKGSLVLNMLYNTMGEENFGKGINEYVRQNLYKNVDSDSLASALTRAQGDLGDGLTPSELISSWADQAGHPVINVIGNYENNTLKITQEGMRVLKYPSLRRLPEQRWTIPIFVATPGFRGNVSAVLRPTDAQKVVAVTTPGIALVNAHRQVPMRVNYDPRKWLQVASTMEDRTLRTVLDPITRATLFDDAFWFARTKRLDYTLALNLIPGLQYEESTPVVETAMRAMRHLEAILRDSEAEKEFSAYLASEVVGVQYGSLGWSHGRDDDEELRLRRALIASWACSVNVKACVSNALRDYQSWLSNKKVSRDTLPTAICQGMKANGAKDFLTVVSMLFDTRKEDQEMRAAIVGGLGCISSEPERKRFIMDVLNLNGYWPSDVTLAIDTVIRNGYLNDVIEALTNNFQNISSSLGASGMASLVSTIAENIVKYEDSETLKAAFPSKRASDKIKIALKITEDNVMYRLVVPNIVSGWVQAVDRPVGPTPKPPPDLSYRIPKDIVPQKYDLQIQPDIEKLVVEGQVQIDVGVIENTDVITLHAADLKIDSVVVRNKETNKTIEVNNIHNETERNFIEISLKEELTAKSSYEITVVFVAKISQTDQYGFYTTTYEDENTAKQLLATNFAPIYARRAFPCFDEPHYRTPFTFKIARHIKQTVLTNSDIISSTRASANDTVWDTFNATPAMSTYQVTIVISELVHYSVRPQFNIWSRVDLATNAAANSPKILQKWDKLNELLQLKLPVTKIDLVALPKATGLAEGWGLQTFPESDLVSSLNEDEPISVQTRAWRSVVQGLAYQWFGDAVTVAWWDDAWIKDGINAYLGYEINEPSNKTSGFGEDLTQLVLASDGLETCDALIGNVNTPQEIQLFGSGPSTSIKGGALARLLEDLIGREAMRKALRSYIDKNKFTAAKTEDFVAAVESAVDTPLPQQVKIAAVVDSWGSQSGYPVLNVKRSIDRKKVYLTQERFLAHPNAGSDSKADQSWIIPLNYKSDLQGFKKEFLLPQDQSKVLIVKEPERVIFNWNRAAPYRVNYDEEGWKDINEIAQISNETLTKADRAGMIDDALWLARTGRLDYPTALTTTLTLKQQYDPFVLRSVYKSLSHLAAMVDDNPVKESYQRYIQGQLQSIWDNVGFNPPKDGHESDETRQRREVLSLWLHSLQHPTVVEDANVAFKKWSKDPKSVHKDVWPAVICQGLSRSPPTELVNAFALFLMTDEAADREAIVYGLGCSKAKDGIILLLQYAATLQGFKPSEAGILFDSVATHGKLNIALAHAVDNYTKIEERLGSKVTEDILLNLADKVHTAGQFKIIDKLSENSTGNVAVAISIAKDNIRWQDASLPSVTTWLKENAGPPPTTPKPTPTPTTKPTPPPTTPPTQPPTTAPPQPNPGHRLPETVVPIHYNIEVPV